LFALIENVTLPLLPVPGLDMLDVTPPGKALRRVSVTLPEKFVRVTVAVVVPDPPGLIDNVVGFKLRLTEPGR
jgi:hypothetical protein